MEGARRRGQHLVGGLGRIESSIYMRHQISFSEIDLER